MIETELSREQFAGNGVTTAFPFAFPILDAAELQVILTDADDNDTTLTLDTHYSVAFDTVAGTVTMFTAPANGETLTVLRDMVFKQPTDLISQGGFDAGVLEEALDRVAMQVLQLREALGRAAKVPATSTLTDFDLPQPDDGKVLGWSGGVLANLLFGTTALTVSAFIETLLDDATAAAARGTLGENASGSFFTRKHNFGASAAPTAGDDVGDGYAVGSFWFDTTGDAVYACADASLGAAVWRTMTAERGANGFKNRIINGDVRIDQRNAGAAVTVNNTTTFYGPDRWRATGEAADGVFTIVRSTATPPAGHTHFLRATVTTADASIGAGQRYRLVQVSEGLGMSDLGFGAAGAETVTLSFWVRSSLTGTFGGALRNAGGARSYPFEFDIAAANTWEQKAITIAGDTSGTWPTDATSWGSLQFDLGTGSTYRGTAGAWAGSDYNGVTGAVSLIGTLAASFDLAGVQLEVGSAATEFERVPFGEMLARCQRFFSKSYDLDAVPGAVASAGYCGTGTNSSGDAYVPISFPVAMRAAPTVTLYNHVTGAAGTWQDGGASNRAVATTGVGQSGFTAYCTVAAADSSVGGHWAASAET